MNSTDKVSVFRSSIIERIAMKAPLYSIRSPMLRKASCSYLTEPKRPD